MKTAHSLPPFFFLCLLSISAFAKPQVQKVDGKPLTITWENSRMAQFGVVETRLYIGDAPFQLSENTCSEKPALNCYLKAHIKIYAQSLHWKKHPKPERVGKVLEGTAGGTVFPLSLPLIQSIDARMLKSPLAQNLPADQVVCDGYDWLPGTQNGQAPEKFVIPRWNTEKMETNPETGIMENRIIGGGINVELERNANGVLEVLRAASMFGPIQTLVGGDIMAWILPLSNGEQCQISIKANITKINNEVLALFYEAVYGPEPKEYLWGSDIHSKELNLISSIVDNIDYYKPQ